MVFSVMHEQQHIFLLDNDEKRCVIKIYQFHLVPSLCFQFHRALFSTDHIGSHTVYDKTRLEQQCSGYIMDKGTNSFYSLRSLNV